MRCGATWQVTTLSPPQAEVYADGVQGQAREDSVRASGSHASAELFCEFSLNLHFLAQAASRSRLCG